MNHEGWSMATGMKRWARVVGTSRYHFWATLFWLALAIPTFLWWRESVFWVAMMSWYANVVSHMAAYTAAKAAEETEAMKAEVEAAK